MVAVEQQHAEQKNLNWESLQTLMDCKYTEPNTENSIGDVSFF